MFTWVMQMTALPPVRLASVRPVPEPEELAARIDELTDVLRDVLDALRELGVERAVSPIAPQPVLTPREVEVLRRMAQGDTNARIARRLSVTEGTVKTHVQNILRKLGAANRAEAVSRWAAAGDRQGFLADRPHLVRAGAL